MNKFNKIIIFSFISISLTGCWGWTNFTTYFNTYYNADRLVDESQDEFDYYDRNKRDYPREIVPKYDLLKNNPDNIEKIPDFMTEFIISKDKLQPVRNKLDSVLIKGSKILAKKKDSDYLEGTLFLMAQAYFYRSEWLPCQVKCGELIDIYPEGEKSPDAHLLFSKALLIQKKFYSGKKMLSRTVDIAWQLERYDILSEAFRLQADLAIYEGDEEGAFRPYLQAITQSPDDEMQAKWQLELASALYRTNHIEQAEKAFEKVYEEYDPDYLGYFEAKLYQADCLNRLGRYEEAEEILEKLEKDRKYEEWGDWVTAIRMNMVRLQSKDTTYYPRVTPARIREMEDFADTGLVGNKLVMLYHYQKAMDLYEEDDYQEAQKYFAKARRGRSPAFNESTIMFKYMGDIIQKRRSVEIYARKDTVLLKQFKDGEVAANSYEIGRIYEKLGQKDSSEYYYKLALESADILNPITAKYLYVNSMIVRQVDPYAADSLMEEIVERYPNTEVGVETMKDLGFTDAYLIDTAAELFTSGVDLRKYGDYNFAVRQFRKVADDYPESDYAPRSLYSAGYIYERVNQVRNFDSAAFYYNWLLSDYPNTEYADEIRMGMAYYRNSIDSIPIPDSLNYYKIKKVTPPRAREKKINLRDRGTQANARDKKNGFNLKDLNKNNIIQQSKSLLKNALDKMSSPLDKIDSLKTDLDSLKNMDLNDLKDKYDPRKNPKDSTKTDPKEEEQEEEDIENN